MFGLTTTAKLKSAEDAAFEFHRDYLRMRRALRDIAAMRTAKPSHAARKMADRAELALARADNA